MRKRLLCATDLTVRSDDAVLRTAMLAQQLDAEVLFVHAVDDAQSGRMIRMKVNRAQVRLLSQGERAMKHAPQDAQVAVRLGKPLQVIAAAAREWNPDLIVMALPQRRRLDAVIGTTAERVIRATHRPVLVVSGAAAMAYDSVVLATDLSATSLHVARTVANMGLLDNAYAWFVHAFDPPYYGMLDSEATVEKQIEEHKRRWRNVVMRDLVEDLTQLGIDPDKVSASVQAARPFDAITQAIQQTRPQLLVIGVSRWFMLKRILFGSVADQVFRKIDCDVLAISPPAAPRKSWLRAA
ncbi:MAG TPA: universal stress protein [Povalibacter sp.]|nr:universal stress protein [Povalibacter sp.]